MNGRDALSDVGRNWRLSRAPMAGTHYRRESFSRRGGVDYLRARLEQGSIPEPNSGCLLWTGPTSNGYGYPKLRDGKKHKAHRLAWELDNGPIPAGMFVCHKCDVRACINPTHLFLGTNDDNIKDMVRKDRARSKHQSGEANARAKLTAPQVIAIRQDRRPASQVAADYGISSNNVYNVRNRVTWGHL